MGCSVRPGPAMCFGMSQVPRSLRLTIVHVSLLSLVWLLLPHLEKRLQILSSSPFLDNSSYSVSSKMVVIKCVLMTLKTLTGILLLKDPKRETMVLLSALRGFLPECHTSPDSVVVRKGRCMWPAGAGGVPPPTVLLAPLFPLGSPQCFAQKSGESIHE